MPRRRGGADNAHVFDNIGNAIRAENLFPADHHRVTSDANALLDLCLASAPLPLTVSQIRKVRCLTGRIVAVANRAVPIEHPLR